MTREEAIKHLEEWKECISSAYRRQVIDMAIEALADRPTESDFISKAKVLETYSELYWFDSDCGVVSKEEVDKIYERLQSLPSADAVEVVRCKDCKHRRENCGMGDHRWCDVLKMTTSADDFCSYGKRREP